MAKLRGYVIGYFRVSLRDSEGPCYSPVYFVSTYQQTPTHSMQGGSKSQSYGEGNNGGKKRDVSTIVERSTEPWSILTEILVKNWSIFSHFQFDSIIFQLAGH